MNFITFSFRPLLAGWLALSALSCAVSRSKTRTEQQRTVVSQQTEELRSAALSSHVAEERYVCGKTAVVSEPVPAGHVAAAVPLAALASLPEGAQFAARQGFLTVEARRCGDTLVVAARSDSLPRTVVRVKHSEFRRLRDSTVVRAEESRTAAADSIRQESQTETAAAPSRSRCGWWFVAGAVCCAAAFIGIRRRL